jgi:hypothetical protein
MTNLIPASVLYPPAQRTLDAEHLIERWKEGRSPQTLRAYVNDLNSFAAWMKAQSVGAAINAMLAAGQGEANEIVRTYRSSLSSTPHRGCHSRSYQSTDEGKVAAVVANTGGRSRFHSLKLVVPPGQLGPVGTRIAAVSVGFFPQTQKRTEVPEKALTHHHPTVRRARCGGKCQAADMRRATPRA